MKRFLVWLFDYRCKDCEVLSKSLAEEMISQWERIVALEQRIIAQEEALQQSDSNNSKDIGELQERMEMPKRRGPSGRPFSQLVKVAEQGERARAKT